MGRLRRHFQELAVRAAIRSAGWHAALARTYRLSIVLLRALAGGPPTGAIYLRQGLLEEGWIPGASDVDTLFLLTPGTETDSVALDALRRRLDRAQTICPFLGEAQIADGRALALYLRHGDAKRRTAARWVRLAGRDAPRGAAPDARWAWDCGARALTALELLQEKLWSPPDDHPTLRAVAARKHLLDVARWLAWARAPDADLWSRDETASRLAAGRLDSPDVPPPPPARWRPGDFSVEALPELAGWALDALSGFAARLTAGASAPAAPARWSTAYAEDAWESQAHEKTFRAARDLLDGRLDNLLWNTHAKSFLIVPDDGGARLAAAFRRLDPAGRARAGLAGPTALLTGPAFRFRLWTAVDGTPFGAWGLREDADGERAVAWRFSSRPLLRAHFGGRARRVDAGAPPEDRLAAATREAAANWLMHWRNGPRLAPGSPPLYAWKTLVMPALTLRLYLETGRAGDPQDLEGALRAYGDSFPTEKVWAARGLAALETEEDDWGYGGMETLFRESFEGLHRAAGALADVLDR